MTFSFLSHSNIFFVPFSISPVSLHLLLFFSLHLSFSIFCSPSPYSFLFSPKQSAFKVRHSSIPSLPFALLSFIALPPVEHDMNSMLSTTTICSLFPSLPFRFFIYFFAHHLRLAFLIKHHAKKKEVQRKSKKYC